MSSGRCPSGISCPSLLDKLRAVSASLPSAPTGARVKGEVKESFDFSQLLIHILVVLYPLCEEVDLLLQVADIDLELVAGPSV